ncbi:serine/threonine-protein kinase [Archangium sp.]|uniref:serine/threonine-protein kinase n=1 Tax=Archangium sp. TaxID=1872627 RepID=UPI00286C2723|nr:serine/threonine-protein kinase [Archangium sp.]
MFESGARIGDYEIWGRIGGGGMGDVWLARHVLLASPLVVKTLKPHFQADPEERYRRMLNEARLMARVPSHRVVRATDVRIHQGTPLLVQEYVDGIDLDEVDVRRRRALGYGLPLWFVCEVLAQVAEGLAAAHLTGILHRDLKPSNILASPELGTKLGDFGIAVAKSVGHASVRDISGTGPYMAPEVLRGEAFDRRADVFGLGATAYHLRYGHPPFEGFEPLLRGEAHPVFPTPSGPEEAYFQHVLARMLAPHPETRFPDVAQVRHLFERLATTTRPPGAATRLDDGSLAFGHTRIVCETGDLARARVDGIVSPAVPNLSMAGGAAAALRAQGGESILEEAQHWGKQPLGACISTGAGRLECKRVLHAVSAWEEVSCIGRAMQRALLTAEEEGLRSLAVPALGTGSGRVTVEASARAEASALRWHLLLGGSQLREVRFVLYEESLRERFRDVLESVLLAADAPTHEVGRPARLVAGAPDDKTYVPAVARRAL